MTIYGLSPEQKALYNQALTGCMSVPPGAKPNKRGDKAWVEKFLIESIDFEPDVELNNMEPGDVTGRVTIGLVVDPTSRPFDEESPNIGHTHREAIHFNWSCYARDPKNPRGHTAMTRMAIETFGSFVTALGFDPREGMVPSDFIDNYRDEILYRKVYGRVVQKDTSDRGPQDEVRRFLECKED